METILALRLQVGLLGAGGGREGLGQGWTCATAQRALPWRIMIQREFSLHATHTHKHKYAHADRPKATLGSEIRQCENIWSETSLCQLNTGALSCLE